MMSWDVAGILSNAAQDSKSSLYDYVRSYDNVLWTLSAAAM